MKDELSMDNNITVQILQNQHLIKVLCEDSVAYELRDHFCFDVPNAKHSPKFRARLWDGKIRLFNARSRTLPKGLVHKLEEFAKEREYTFSYPDRPEPDVIDPADMVRRINPAIPPRDYQLDAYREAFENKRRVIISPTGSGKSLIIYMLTASILGFDSTIKKDGPKPEIKMISGKWVTIPPKVVQTNGKKGIIVVPTINLVNQMYGDFTDYSVYNKFNVEDNIHCVHSGADPRTKKPLIISTWQSLYNLPDDFFNDIDFIIGDECHLFTATSLNSIMEKSKKASIRVGFTGTLDGTKINKLVLEGLFGPVYQNTTTKQLTEEKYLAEQDVRIIVLKHPPSVCEEFFKKMAPSSALTYQNELQLITNSERRNNFITNLTVAQDGNTLVLFRLVEHGKVLLDLLNKKLNGETRKVFFIYGKTDAEYRNEIRAITEKETNAIILASVGVFSTGANIKNLHNVILASPTKSKIRNLQSIGRVLRITDTKKTAKIYDLADDLRHKRKENYTLKHLKERLKVYKEEKFAFKLYNVDL